MLRARLLDRLIRTKSLYIDDNPIVGTVTAYPAGVYVYPEWDAEWIMKEMRQTMMSHLGEVNISDEKKKLMIEAGKFFKTRSAASKARALSKQLHGFDPDIPFFLWLIPHNSHEIAQHLGNSNIRQLGINAKSETPFTTCVS